MSRGGEGMRRRSPGANPAAWEGLRSYAQPAPERRAYRRLRRYVAAQEHQTGRRLTHQAIIEAALAEYLYRQGA